MALENIKQMTRSLSSKGDEKKVAQHAPEDYLKRAVEQFIIEFPEFEDLPSEELYKEMEKKGYFSDRWASSDYGIPITPDYMRDALLGGYGDHIHGLSDDELRNMDDDMIKEIYDDINDMFKYGKIGELKKEIQVASDPHPMEGYDDLLEKSAIEVFGKKLKYLTNDEYEELEHRIRDMDIDIPAAAKGGIMDINRMTAPLGYAAGGPAPKESGGLQPPTGLSKWYADKFPVDPIHQMKENLIDKGKRTVKGIGKGLSELFGAKPAEAGTFTEDLEMEIIKLQSEIQSLQLDNLLMGTDNDKAITSKQNLLDYYMSLK